MLLVQMFICLHNMYILNITFLCDMRAISHKPGDQVKALGLGSG